MQAEQQTSKQCCNVSENSLHGSVKWIRFTSWQIRPTCRGCKKKKTGSFLSETPVVAISRNRTLQILFSWLPKTSASSSLLSHQGVRNNTKDWMDNSQLLIDWWQQSLGESGLDPGGKMLAPHYALKTGCQSLDIYLLVRWICVLRIA